MISIQLELHLHIAQSWGGNSLEYHSRISWQKDWHQDYQLEEQQEELESL